MKFILFLIVILNIQFSAVFAAALHLEKLSIIGGGIAGAHAAHLLRHQHPLLITKERDFGGKCVSDIVAKRAFDHGAIQVPPYYHRVRAMSDNLELTLIPNPDAYGRDGSSIFDTIIQTYGMPKFVGNFAKYAYHAWYYRDLTVRPWEVENYPEVQMSVTDYLLNHSMEAVTPLFDVVLKGYGYGDLDAIPMFHAFSIVPASQIGYGMLNLTPFANTFMPTSVNLIKEGYQGLVQGVVKASGVEVLTDHTVKKIDLRKWEETGKSLITFKGGKKLESEKVILCTPPSEVEILYANPVTQSLMDELRKSLITSPYGTAIFETKSPLPHDLIVENTSTKSFDPIMIGRKFPDQNIYIAYIYGHQNDAKAIKKALKKYTSTYFNEDNIDIHSLKMFDNYYPHPTFDAIANGFYSKMERLQGDSGLYFAGSYLNFEIVERAMENVETLVERHFT